MRWLAHHDDRKSLALLCGLWAVDVASRDAWTCGVRISASASTPPLLCALVTSISAERDVRVGLYNQACLLIELHFADLVFDGGHPVFD